MLKSSRGVWPNSMICTCRDRVPVTERLGETQGRLETSRRGDDDEAEQDSFSLLHCSWQPNGAKSDQRERKNSSKEQQLYLKGVPLVRVGNGFHVDFSFVAR